MRTLALLVAVTRAGLIQMWRYFFDTAVQLLTLYLIFLLMFLGFRAVRGDAADFGDSVGGLVVGFMVYTLAIGAFSQLSNQLMQEALQGTLEQLAMSPLGLGRVIVCRILGGTLVTFGLVFGLLFMMMATTGRWLPLDLVSLLPLLFAAALGVHGIGFALGGLAVVFKRIQSTFVVVQFALVALVAIPVDQVPRIAWLPLAWAATLLHRVMVEGVSIFDLPAPDLAFLCANSAAYFAAGLLVFKRMEFLARDRGLLGHY